ncbi:alkaline phosphatase [Pedobacter steynii]|uniref:Alkaline phosphatase n=1 Tax=Pedobacter steynii TaxID=430522 RepID=A0A1H0LJB9_9SPHI|nr:alkaline phosphatase [Pedobacter steynii]NQX43491.1 alkaline phosphatase [Pedobacter steynii]SDO68116.1 alkaline phosphatase [Pedobacter steynii]
MNRRSLLKGGLLAGLGLPFLSAGDVLAKPAALKKKAKNIIMLVSDGMSQGTLNMADLYAQRAFGKTSAWMQLYRDNKVTRGLMDTASASSMVTDSAAASSSWGGGMRVNNGSLNVGPKGEKPQPILQKFKETGKKVGCVTTVPITHATPAGFCVNINSRNGMEEIASMYLNLKFDVMMGGGADYFGTKRKDGSLLPKYLTQGFKVVENKAEMMGYKGNGPILGIFAPDGLPYEIDRKNTPQLLKDVPSLAEMTSKAISLMKDHKDGFVLQVEGGRVDWAAHGNDIGGLIFDQLAFDEAVAIAIDFAEKDGETLVIITTDHANANPGLFSGSKADKNFDSLQLFKHSNQWVLNQLNRTSSPAQVMELIKSGQGMLISDAEAKNLLTHFSDIQEGQLYNDEKLPFYEMAKMQFKHTSVGWAGMDHAADFVEIAMFGPGSEQLRPLIKNTEVHNMMLHAAEVAEHYLVKA